MAERRQRRLHPDGDPLTDPHGRGDELDPVAERVGEADVDQFDGLDALDPRGGEGRRAAEGEGRQQGDLVPGVEAADVGGRIGLRVTQALGFVQHLGERPSRRFHLREDEVAGAVQDAGDLDHFIADESLPQHLHGRRAAHHRRLEQERDALGFGDRRQPGPVFGEEGLVGGDHRLARLERGFHRRPRRALGAADQFDEDVDVIGARQGDRIVEPGRAGNVAAATSADAGHHGRAARRRERRTLGQEGDERPAHDAQAGDADPPGAGHQAETGSGRSRLRIWPDWSRKRFTLRAAWRMRCSFSTRPMRT